MKLIIILISLALMEMPLFLQEIRHVVKCACGEEYTVAINK